MCDVIVTEFSVTVECASVTVHTSVCLREFRVFAPWVHRYACISCAPACSNCFAIFCCAVLHGIPWHGGSSLVGPAHSDPGWQVHPGMSDMHSSCLSLGQLLNFLNNKQLQNGRPQGHEAHLNLAEEVAGAGAASHGLPSPHRMTRFLEARTTDGRGTK